MKPLIRSSSLLATAALLAACASTTQFDYSHDGLELRDVRGLDEVWVRPGTDFASYEKLFIEPVEVAFDPHWDPRRTGSRLPLRDKDREQIRTDTAELFDTTFKTELARSDRFELVDQTGPNTLIFKPQIIDLIINAPEDPTAVGISRTYVSEFGRVTLIGELKDAETGAILARIADREIARAISPLEFADRFANEREGERVVRKWADALIEPLSGLGDASR
ncbi:MAG: DUF3313 family protein [Wenzhouxiangella sp.]|nr:DUF3313 family protein [Wenzhouxiangella sp.]